MPHFIRISDNQYVNLDDVRDIYIDPDESETKVTVTWRGMEAAIDVFEGEDGLKLMGFVHLCSIASLRRLNQMAPPEETPDELTLD